MRQDKRDLLTLLEFTPKEVERILDLAQRVKAKPERYARALSGRSVALLFEKASTRTRVSFEVGIHQLGGQAVVLKRDEIQLGRGETVADTARVLSRYVHAVMLRTYAHATAAEFAENASVPVVNGLTDLHHPCQALADLLTLREEYGRLAGLKLAYVGDGNNVLHSLLVACAKTGVHVSAACPKGYDPDSAVLRAAQAEALRRGCRVEVLREPETAVRGSHAVYTDVWTSMGQEKEGRRRRKAFRNYAVTGALLAKAPQAVFLHCLPAHRGEEVEAAVIDGRRSRVWDQAENRLHVQKAVLLTLLTKKRTKI